jgi:hypothetical protein
VWVFNYILYGYSFILHALIIKVIIWAYEKVHVVRFDNQGITNLLCSTVTMSFCVSIFGFLISFFLSSFCVAISDFRYHYLSISLYLLAILVVIVENDLENKIIHVLSLSNTLCIKILKVHLGPRMSFGGLMTNN